MNFKQALNIEDLRVIARKRLPRIAYDFLDRGTEEEVTLAADMVFVGRATLFGATAGGEAGALHALGLLKSEVGRVMALLGCNSIAELGPHYLRFDEAPRADQARMVLQRQAV